MNEEDKLERSAKLEELRQTIQVGLDLIETEAKLFGGSA